MRNERAALTESSRGIGSIGVPRWRTSKWRCGPVECPVEPTAPIGVPPTTYWPGETAIVDRCAYQLS